jgi:hypothetical protein
MSWSFKFALRILTPNAERSGLAMEGGPFIPIKELMGHKTLAMTERNSHLIPNINKQAELEIVQTFRVSIAVKVKEEQAEVA